MGSQTLQTPASREAFPLWTPCQPALPDALVTAHLLALTVWLAGCWLAPSELFQDRWVYFCLAPLAVVTLLGFGRSYFASAGCREGLFVFLAALLLCVPVLWSTTSSLPDEIRRHLKDAGFVMALLVSTSVCMRVRGVTGLLPWVMVGAGGIAALPVLADGLSRAGRPPSARGWGTLGDNPNETGLILAVSIIAAVALLLDSGRRRQVALGGVAIFLLLPLWLTEARSALAGLPAGLLAGLCLPRHRQHLLLCLCVGGAVLAAIAYPALLDWVRSDTLSGRTFIWERLLEEMRGHWAGGLGLGGPTRISFPTLGLELHHHSLYLSTLYHGGVFALAVLVVLLTRTLARAWRGGHPNARPFVMLLVFGLVTQLVEGRYPIGDPASSWLYTWFPIIVLAHLPGMAPTESRKHKNPRDGGEDIASILLRIPSSLMVRISTRGWAARATMRRR